MRKCDPKGRDCIENNFARTFNCSTSCVGLYADVKGKRNTVEQPADDGPINKSEGAEKLKFQKLIMEYRNYKKKFVQHFSFNSTLSKSKFGPYF